MRTFLLFLFLLRFTSLAQEPSLSESQRIALIEKLEKQVVAVVVYKKNLQEKQTQPQLLSTSFSGVILDKEGHILTVGEVAMDPESITVSLNDGEIYTATVIAVDLMTNVGIIKISSKSPLSPIVWGNSDLLKTGSTVLAIGNPFDFYHSFSLGYISGLDRFISQDLPPMLQTSTPINPGDPGGLVANSAGEFVGMMYTSLGPQSCPLEKEENELPALETLSQILEKESLSTKEREELKETVKKHIQKLRRQNSFNNAQGINFCFPSNRIRYIISQLMMHGKVLRGKLGVSVNPIPYEMKKARNLSTGALIRQVVPDSPAFNAGIQENDILLSCNGVPIKNFLQVRSIIQENPPGTVVVLEILRGTTVKTVSIALGN